VGRRVSLGLAPPCWLCHGSQLLGAIKDWFEGQPLNFFPVPNKMAVIILARSSQNYPSVPPCLREVFGIKELKLSASVL
jgi:hypothetical protein